MTAQSGLGFAGIVAIQIPDDGATGEVLTKLTPDNYDYDWAAGGGGGPTVDPGTVDDSLLRWNTVTPAWEEFTAFILPTTDGLTDQIMSTDGAGAVSWVDPPAGGGLLSAEYRFSTSTVAADPGSGRYRFDTAAYATVTEIFIDDDTDNGVDISNLLTQIGLGDRLYFQVKSEANKFVVFDVTGPAVDNVGWFTIPVNDVLSGDFFANNDRCVMIWSVGGTPETLQTAYNEDTTVPQITINATPDPLTIDASVAGDIFAVRDTIGQDMIRLSTTGGSVVGGSNAGNILTLEGALAGSADTGIVRVNSPLDLAYNTIDNTTPAQAFMMTWAPTFTASASYIGGALSVAPTVTITTGVFIPATFSDTSNMLTAATPGFSAFTFINELAVIRNSGNFNLMSALIVNVGLTHERNTSGTSTTPGPTGFSFSPQTRTTVSGAVLTKTAQTALRCSVTYSTVAGSTANMGLIRGLHVFNPALALFQPGAGAETATGVIGVDYNNITFGGNITKAAVRSAHISTGSLSYFLLNTGNAVSDFGSSNIHFNDINGIQFGTPLSAPDLNIGVLAGGVFFWNWTTGDTGQLRNSSEVGGAGAPLAPADRFLWTSTVRPEYTFDCDRFSLGAQTGNNGNTVGNFVTPARTIGLAGDWSDFLLTQGASLTVGGLAMGRVSAWVVNGISYAASTGSILNTDTLTVGGMVTSSPGVTVTERQSLHVIAGRSRFQSAMQYDPINPATLAAGNNNNWAGLLTGTANNGMRHWARVNGDAGGTSVITGIDATSAQDGDTFKITNVSAFTVTIGHQDVGSTATNRIISPTGANYVIGADESLEVIRDVTTDRWRILYGSGA